jgi:hypothetical protein
VPVEVIIARTDQTVVAVTGICAYPAGLANTLHLRLRDISLRQEQQFVALFGYGLPEGEPLPEEFLPFGVQFADGRKATNLDRHPSADRASRTHRYWSKSAPAVSRTEIDAGLVLRTANRAVTLWPDDHGPAGAEASYGTRPAIGSGSSETSLSRASA